MGKEITLVNLIHADGKVHQKIYHANDKKPALFIREIDRDSVITELVRDGYRVTAESVDDNGYVSTWFEKKVKARYFRKIDKRMKTFGGLDVGHGKQLEPTRLN